MSREGIIDQLQARDTFLEEMIYGQATVSVYKGQCHGYPAAVKVLHFSRNTDYRLLERECEPMNAFPHPNIVKLYDSFWVTTANQYYFVIVVEWCDKDLDKDMKQRIANNFMWGETELLALTRDLIIALAYLQKAGVAHRDIKPANIFLTSNHKVKLGDFGSAKPSVDLSALMTLTGTPFYLSPILRESLRLRNPKVAHNVYKSDVYSLGLTLLSLALLRAPIELANPKIAERLVFELVNSIAYSDYMKIMLMNMLRSDESVRWDFLQLETYVTPQESVVPDEELPPLSRPSVKTPRKTSCLGCGGEIDLFRSDAECEVVQLYCDPQHHMFCTRRCCCNYLKQSGSKVCPDCKVQIDQGTISFVSETLEYDAVKILDYEPIAKGNQTSNKTSDSYGWCKAWCGICRK